jgi:DNA-binding Xre family transcriptional regulator
MLLKTRVFDLCPERYKNLSELAQAMEISVSQIYRVQDGKRKINYKFIVGAIKAFPGCSFDDLFYFVPEVPAGKESRAAVASGSRS